MDYMGIFARTELTEAGKRLRTAREKADLTRDELAQRAGVSRNTIVRYEQGKIARADNLEPLCRALGLAPSTLLGDEENLKKISATIEKQAGFDVSSETPTSVLGTLAEFSAAAEIEARDARRQRTAYLADAMRIVDQLPYENQRGVLTEILNGAPSPLHATFSQLVGAFFRGAAGGGIVKKEDVDILSTERQIDALPPSMFARIIELLLEASPDVHRALLTNLIIAYQAGLFAATTVPSGDD